MAPLKDKGKLHSDDRSKVEILNQQFSSVFTKKTEKPFTTVPGEKVPEMQDIQIDVPGVQKLLSDLKIKKASGPDNLPNTIIKGTADEIAPALAEIFRLSIHTGNLPTDWSRANISPVFKKGSKQEAGNFRPVSLTCVCCKILEHIVPSAQ